MGSGYFSLPIKPELQCECNQKGEWFLRELYDEPSPLRIPSDLLALFPWLEMDWSDFQILFQERIPESWQQSFPLHALIQYPFSLKMEYWADLALTWIVDAGWVEILRPWAETLDQTWMPQSLQHKFWRIMKPTRKLSE
ncbi:MAG TPA: hypothetical protein DCE41_14995 [Cytophagales bacterium]|nr:hypothetical protein [Cytophagales bacterium]HAA24043.1 hypothetical protein [Cytophagales bacterium]HAP64694.1 hypothetical protein [Cytophagales bacterium]